MAKTFGAQSTTDEVLEGVDLSGKRILVTGASAGIGVETCRSLAAHGAAVTGAVRDMDKARRNTAEVKAQARNGFDLVELDLANLASVRACADKLNAAGKPFDVVICNAGIMACPPRKTDDGFEMQFGTNHLGHFVLVNRIAPLIKAGGRIVNLSSSGHRASDVNLDDPNFERTEYTPFGAYGRSKTANILFAVGLDKRLKGKGIRAAAVHPGVIPTELGRHMTPEVIAQMRGGGAGRPANAPAPQMTYKTIPQGAATTVWSAVVAPGEAVGAHYCEDCHVAEIADDPASRGGVRAYAVDPARAEALWAKSEQMVGEAFAYS